MAPRPSRRHITKLTAKATFETPKRTKVRIRQHTAMVDDATERGGTDTAANPPETLLAALAGCLNIQVNRLAKERGIRLKNIRIEIDADFDRRGVTWGEDVPVPYPLIRLSVTGKSDASANKLTALRRDMLNHCPVSRVLVEGGTRFRQNWKITAL
jgi:putative redox protein